MQLISRLSKAVLVGVAGCSGCGATIGDSNGFLVADLIKDGPESRACNQRAA